MSAISLKLSAELLETSERCAEALRLSRAEYIRRAITRMNRETGARLRAKRLTDLSLPRLSEPQMPERGEIWLANLNPRRGTKPRRSSSVKRLAQCLTKR